MTGRELIIYILENHLENEEIFKGGKIPGFLSVMDFARKQQVGNATVMIYIARGMVPSIKIGDVYYIPENAKVKK